MKAINSRYDENNQKCHTIQSHDPVHELAQGAMSPQQRHPDIEECKQSLSPPFNMHHSNVPPRNTRRRIKVSRLLIEYQVAMSILRFGLNFSQLSEVSVALSAGTEDNKEVGVNSSEAVFCEQEVVSSVPSNVQTVNTVGNSAKMSEADLTFSAPKDDNSEQLSSVIAIGCSTSRWGSPVKAPSERAFSPLKDIGAGAPWNADQFIIASRKLHAMKLARQQLQQASVVSSQTQELPLRIITAAGAPSWSRSFPDWRVASDVAPAGGRNHEYCTTLPLATVPPVHLHGNLSMPPAPQLTVPPSPQAQPSTYVPQLVQSNRQLAPLMPIGPWSNLPPLPGVPRPYPLPYALPPQTSRPSNSSTSVQILPTATVPNIDHDIDMKVVANKSTVSCVRSIDVPRNIESYQPTISGGEGADPVASNWHRNASNEGNDPDSKITRKRRRSFSWGPIGDNDSQPAFDPLSTADRSYDNPGHLLPSTASSTGESGIPSAEMSRLGNGTESARPQNSFAASASRATSMDLPVKPPLLHQSLAAEQILKNPNAPISVELPVMDAGSTSAGAVRPPSLSRPFVESIHIIPSPTQTSTTISLNSSHAGRISAPAVQNAPGNWNTVRNQSDPRQQPQQAVTLPTLSVSLPESTRTGAGLVQTVQPLVINAASQPHGFTRPPQAPVLGFAAPTMTAPQPLLVTSLSPATDGSHQGFGHPPYQQQYLGRQPYPSHAGYTTFTGAHTQPLSIPLPLVSSISRHPSSAGIGLRAVGVLIEPVPTPRMDAGTRSLVPIANHNPSMQSLVDMDVEMDIV